MPPHPTRSAFVRASTLSLGSIPFGSLIVTILELVRILLNVASQEAGQDGNRTLVSHYTTPFPIPGSILLVYQRRFLHFIDTVVYGPVV